MAHKIRVSSRAIIINDDKILLNSFDSYYNFPGGGIEENETAKQAVIREVLEETGLTVDVGELVFTLEYEPTNCNEKYGNTHHISLFFRCYINNDILPLAVSEPDMNPENKIASVAKWVSLSDLNKINLVPKINKPLEKYADTGVFSPAFWAENEHLS